MSKKIPFFVLILILVVSFFAMISVSKQESAIMDELAHIPAGYSYLRYLDFRLNPEHPPLIKAISAIPLMSMGLSFPVTQPSWTDNINDQWVAGNQFIYKSGNDADRIIFWARLGPILLTLLLVVLIYIWARELLGGWWGLLPAFLFAFSPTVLAHGHYVTTDIGAAFGVVLATYFFIKFLLKPTGKYLIFAGLAFGVAELMKFSTVLLIPYFIALVLVWTIRKLPAQAGRRFWRKLLFLAAIFVIGYVLVYLVYFLFTLNYPISKQVADTQSILTSFKTRLFADIDIKMAGDKFLRPLAHYLLGVLMVSQRSVGGNTAYFLGGISAAGWWYYFPVVFLLKEPIPSLILIFIALIFCLWNFMRSIKFKASCFMLYVSRFKDYLGTHLPEFAMLFFIIFYWLYSMQGKLNIGVRHILPTMPFIYILAAAGLKSWVNNKFWKHSFKISLIFVLLFWYLLETIFAYPFYLSYFNQFGGGVFGGYRYVTDSNYDWGQDLKRLTVFVEEKGIQKIAVDYFGGGDTKYYLGDKMENWWSNRGNPQDIGIEWLAVSVNTLQSALAKAAPGFERKSEDEYRWLQEIKNPFQPDYRIGTSIFVYKL
ncbi:MAG: glycosyltransferase family 39 protein [bacterium]|nr:glycosyltransferase family 39 protein [bacterium]